MTVVVVGSVNMDAVVRVDRLPGPGETVLGHTLDSVPGGKGANQAAAAARLGAPTALVARVGDDDAGRTLVAALAGEGVDVRAVATTPGTATGVALITVDAAGANSIVVAPLANHSLSAVDIDAAAELIAGARVLLCQLEVPLAAVERALQIARAAGVTTVLNPSPAPGPDVGAALLELVDVVVANEHEAEALALQCPAVIVTRGARGAVVFVDGRYHELSAFPVTAVDTTAAGDAFCGALVAGLAAGRTVLEAARPALAAGALAVTRPGALPSLPTAAEVAALLQEVRT
ncbi:MAG TPA: ribokinase [Acidimicrobiales bacterium]|nr:ribokinase [Acidimicrobiales bacterium]